MFSQRHELILVLGAHAQNAPEIDSRVTIAGPAIVRISPVVGAKLFITYKKDRNEGSGGGGGGGASPTAIPITPIPVFSPTPTATATATFTPFPLPTVTPTPIFSPTPTATATATFTPFPLPTVTPTPIFSLRQLRRLLQLLLRYPFHRLLPDRRRDDPCAGGVRKCAHICDQTLKCSGTKPWKCSRARVASSGPA
jgi:hypothetical protein